MLYGKIVIMLHDGVFITASLSGKNSCHSIHSYRIFILQKKEKKTVKVTPTWITSPEAPSRATDEYYTTVLTSDTYPPHVKSVSSLCETFIP